MRKSKKAVSPVVATVILIAVFIAVVSAALSFAEVELSSYYAQSDLQQSSTLASQVAQGINAVALTFGRSVSIGYSFKYASIAVIPNVVKYVIQISSSECPNNMCYVYAYTGMLVIAIPAHYYSLGNDYMSTIYPASFPITKTFVSKGGSGSIALAFTKEFESNGIEFLYTVVVPVPLEVNTTQSIGGSQKIPVVRLYFVQLSNLAQQYPLPSNCTANPPKASVSILSLKSGYITVQGQGSQVCTVIGVTSISIQWYPMSTLYSSQFFNFPQTGQVIVFPNGNAELQVYIGDVGVGGP